jgi:signal transduction histidine kinase
MTDKETISPPDSETWEGCLLYVDAEVDDAVLASLRDAETDFDILTRSTIDAALTTLATERVDCLCSEYTLPDGDGIELLRAVRQRRPDLPVLLVTDDGDESVASAAIDAGVTDYLRKSSEMELARRVDEAVGAHPDRAPLDRMTDAFMAMDTSWQFTYVNDRAQDVLSDAIGEAVPVDELLGSEIWAELPAAVDTQFYEEYHRAMEEQEPTAFEAHYEPLETWFDVRVFPSETGLSVYFRDITEQKAREAELAKRERILQDIHRVIADKGADFEEKVDDLLGIVGDVLETDGAALSRIEGEEYIFETVRDDGLSDGDVVPLAATNCERAAVEERTLVLSDVATQAPELTDKAGFTEMGIACYLGTPVLVDGEVYGTFCFYDREPHDDPFDEWEVTLVDLLGNWVSYELEREHRQRELARERNRLDDFASAVSHDLRNPLHVAKARVDLLEPSEEGHVETAMDALTRMDELIDDMLTMARMGDHAIDTAWVDFGTMARDAWETAETGAATLTVERTGRLVVDDSRLRQLLENLFRNAVQHGGSAVTAGILADGFYVADDGPGIPAELKEHLFQPMVSGRADGTGLGLTIAQSLVGRHHGLIECDSSPAGTTFRMLLPLEPDHG